MGSFNRDHYDCMDCLFYLECCVMEIENERLRTRCAELSAEVERLQHVAEITNKAFNAEIILSDSRAEQIKQLQSVIDEANAQEHYGVYSCNKHDGYFDFTAIGVRPEPGYSVNLYARPIPAQQSPAATITNDHLSALESDIDRLNKNAPFYPADAATLANACVGLIAEVRRLQQSPAVGISKMESFTTSPAVAVPDCDKLDVLIDELRDHIAQPPHLKSEEFIKGCLHSLDVLKCRTKTKRELLLESPHITEQDAREIIINYQRFIPGDELITEFLDDWISASCDSGCRALLNKLNGGKNGQ